MNLAINLKWIDVAAALPDDETLVLLAVNDDDVCPGFRLEGTWRYTDAMPITVERVTHWMAMPPAPAAPVPADWAECQRVADLPAVHEALQGFSEDSTGDNGTCVVRAVLEATAQPTAAPTPQAQPAGAQLPDWIGYDEASDVLTIHGIKYSGNLMRDLGGSLPLEQPFVIRGRRDGVLTVFRLPTQPAGAAPTPHEQEARTAVERMERAEWAAVLNALNEARKALCADGARHTWLDGAINLASERAKGNGTYSAQAGMLPEAQTDAARDVLAERRRQVEQEGWTPEGDDRYDRHELSLAAGCYLLAGAGPHSGAPESWPWEQFWWKPADDRRNLVKAGALILADIERLDRAKGAAGLEGGAGVGS